MFFFIIILNFFQINDEAYLKEKIKSKHYEDFIEAVNELEKVDSEFLGSEFKNYLIFLAMEKFDKEIISSLEKSIFFKWIDQFGYYLLPSGKIKKKYEIAILNLIEYVSGFKNNKYVEEIFKRFVCKELIIKNEKEVFYLIIKYKRDLYEKSWRNKKLLGSIISYLKLSDEGRIKIEDVDKELLLDILLEFYKTRNIKEKCETIVSAMAYLREKYEDFYILEDSKKCICLEKYVSGVLLFEMELAKNKIKGTDILIKKIMDKEKDDKIRKVHNEILELYSQDEKTYSEKIDIFASRKIKNKYCK